MRTAFCFSGELRSIDKTYDLLKNKLMNRFSDYDIFYHTWNDDPDMEKLHYIEKDPHTKDILIEERKTFDESSYNTRKRDEVSVQGMLRQLYCLKQCNTLKLIHEVKNSFKYDIVVRIRPDTLIVNHTFLEKTIEQWDMKNYIYTSDHDDHLGYNDRFYLSNSENMDYISNRFDYLPEYYDKGGLIHYEIFFRTCVTKLKLDVCRTQMQFALLRTNGDISTDLVKYYNILDI
jgi:hypothetical protein